MADDERGRRILYDVNIAFKRDPNIDEFGFIPCPEAIQNKSPVILEQHKLGLESWSVTLVFQYAYNQLMQARQKQIRLEPKDLISCSRAVLLINPECYTVWNARKELIRSGHLDIQTDLKFSSLVLTRQPKSPETFSHRKWVLLQLLKQQQEETSNGRNGLDDELPSQNNQGHTGSIVADDNVISDEFAVCSTTAERYANNYSAWSHRIWTIQHLTKCSEQLLLAELSKTERVVSMHVSDHSGFHYRQFLISELSKANIDQDVPSASKMAEVLESEMKLTAELIKSYPGHEAIWYHRRFLFHLQCHLLNSSGEWERTCSQSCAENDATILRQTTCTNSETQCKKPDLEVLTATHQSEGRRGQANPREKKFRADAQGRDSELFAAELKFIDKCVENVCTCDNSIQLRCAEAYRKWLNFIRTEGWH